MKKTILLTFFALWLTASPFSPGTIQTVSAGQSGCQTGGPTAEECRAQPSDPEKRRKCCEQNPPWDWCPNALQQQRKVFASATINYERNQTPGAGALSGGDSETRSNFSFYAAILVLFGGIWALFVLSLNRFGKRIAPNRGRFSQIYKLAFQPASAITAFGLLFVAAIIGGVLTAPVSVTAEKRDQRSKRKMTGFMNPSNKPVFKNAQAIGGDGTTQIGAPVFDHAGNRYVRGGFTGSLTAGAQTLQASRYFDAFVAKYDANGNSLWTRQATGATAGIAADNSIEGATALAVDGNGNVYIGGSFVKTMTLQGGANQSATLTDNGVSGVNYESFVAKYDAAGNLLWARGGNTNSPKSQTNLETGQNAINQIVFDNSGNPYVTGFVSGTNFLNSAATNAGQSDIVLARLNPSDGAVVWKQVIGGANDDNGLDLKIDGSNNLYLIGNYGSAQITFPTSPATTFTNADDSTATFIAKFDSAGANLWAKELDNESLVGGSQIAVNGLGEIFLTGYFLDSATFGDTFLFESEGSGEDEESLGGFVAKMDADGEFVWAEGFGGIGEAIALDPMGRVYVAGPFYDGGTFGYDTPNEDTLASYGGVDLFVARYDPNGGFEWAKPIAGSGIEGTQVIGNPDGVTENNYNPLGIAYNPARNSMFVSGDFQRAIALDCITLTTDGNLQSYVAEISGDAEPTSCRVWNGLDEDDNDWDSTDNWNAGGRPSAGESVFVPYTGNDYDPPTFNPTTNIPLSRLTVADDRILTLEQALTINNRLDLLGGFVDAENFPLLFGSAAQSFSINDGLVLGRVQKQFAAGAGAFTFPVGTASSEGYPEYSPVTLSNIAGAGSFSVAANKGAYQNAVTDLPAARAARWWNLTNGGLTKADLTFQYIDGDISTATENQYRAYRIPTGGGAATYIGSIVNAAANTVTAPNINGFSDWTLAQPDENSVTIAGTAVYATTPNGQPTKVVPGVVLTAQGTNSAIASTDSGGAYSLGGRNQNGQYTVTASKTGNVKGIDAFDATLVLRCVAAGNNCALTSNQKIAGDTDGDGTISAFDATHILRYVAAGGTNSITGQTGVWKFTPGERKYEPLLGSQFDQNYEAVLVGEVSGDWSP